MVWGLMTLTTLPCTKTVGCGTLTLSTGVSEPKVGSFRATLNMYGVSKILGHYETCNEAFNVYNKTKSKYIIKITTKYFKPVVYQRLHRIASSLDDVCLNYKDKGDNSSA